MGTTLLNDDNIQKITFNRVRDGLGKNEIYLIDVRTSEERVNPGRIPGSLHVPFCDISLAFSSMTLEEFEAEYDFKRPKISGEEKTIVLTCQTGLQASQAAHQLLKSGYVKLAVHQGGFNDWREKGGKCVDGKMDHNKLIDFEEVRVGIENDSLVMIDVRNRHELVKSGPNGGRIPGTKNVPLSEIWDAFAHMSSEAFRLKYNFEKPDQSTRLGLNCLKGIRAFSASDKLLLLAYENVSVYKGSLLDWKAKGGQFYCCNSSATLAAVAILQRPNHKECLSDCGFPKLS